MKGAGEVLLISCYELGHQPNGITSPMAFLEQAGYVPDSIDLAVQKLNIKKVTRAKFVGISVPMHTALRIGVKVAARIREINPACHISFFGLYASLNADDLLKEVADSAIGGEYEAPLVALVENLTAGRNDPIAGVCRKETMAPPYLGRLTFLPPSRVGLPPLSQYAHLEYGDRRLVGHVEASRGCRHLCLHCPIPPVYQGRFFLIPKEVVFEDIRNLVSMGARHITFGDPDFLNGPNHSLRIVREMHHALPDITFDFTAKIEHLIKHKNVIPEFKGLGCLFIVSAVESLSDTVLSHLKKGHTRSDVVAAAHIVRDAGIYLRPSLVPFTPWSTLDDYIDLFDFVEQEEWVDQVDPIQYAIRLLIPPGSLLLGEAGLQPYLGPLVEESFTCAWTHPDPRMDRLQKEVSREVEMAADEAPEAIFYRLKGLAYTACDGASTGCGPRTVLRARPRPPRLTEAWFCCAEPTENQFHIMEESEKVI